MDLANSREETFAPSNIIAGSAPVITAREMIATTQTIPQYAPLGRITASGLVIESIQSASDGSQIPIGIAVHAIDTTGGAARHPVYKGGQFNAALIDWDASWSAAEKAGAFDRTPIDLVTL
jgi:hypothetical protein